MLSFFLCSPPCVEITSHSWCYPGLAISSWQTSFCLSCLLIHNSKERKDAFSILLRLLVFSCWSMSGLRDALGMLLPHKLVLCFLHPWVSGELALGCIEPGTSLHGASGCGWRVAGFQFLPSPSSFLWLYPSEIHHFCVLSHWRVFPVRLLERDFTVRFRQERERAVFRKGKVPYIEDLNMPHCNS